MTHVFIVNDRTLKIHLEYMFAGTGCRHDALFLSDSEYLNPRRNADGLTSTSERNIAAMIADVSRIREGDKIIFYLQATQSHPGLFFGVFRAKGKAFYCPTDESDLNEQLGKNLNFRVLIEADQVYQNGVSEHGALDSIKDIHHPSEMCWSLIYRKLKGNRGCTMLTDFESAKLIEKIRANNNNNILQSTGFSYDKGNARIIPFETVREYPDAQSSLMIKDRLIFKAQSRYAFESHLQAYIIQNFDCDPLHSFINADEIHSPIWIGNEVSCGVGMQRIDILTMQEDDAKIHINIIELKDEKPYTEIITNQLPWYIDWVVEYLCPLYLNKEITIAPIVVASTFQRQRDIDIFENCCAEFEYETANHITVNPIEYIGFEIDENISFEKVF